MVFNFKINGANNNTNITKLKIRTIMENILLQCSNSSQIKI